MIEIGHLPPSRLGTKHSCSTKKKIGDSERGNKHHRWAGESYINPQGYRFILVKGKRVLEHRYIAENLLCRKLKKTDCVHHIDGNKLNNYFRNLKVLSPVEHAKIHKLGHR